VVESESAPNMFLYNAKTKAMELLHSETGSAPVEFATIVVAMFIVLLPSVAYYSSRVQKLFMLIAELWRR
jgi:Flp pilus assembly protein TadG